MIGLAEQALILIVDDNPHNLQVVANIVKENGLKVAVAQNGRQALDFLQTKLPDLVLMDIMMPDMDGLETCRRMKKNEQSRDIPVIFITALSGTEDVIRAFDAGGGDYITKPFVKEEVQARINVHLKLKKAMEKMKKMSVTDEMTGVFNRRYAFHVLNREINVSQREKKKFVVCYVDIDKLKIVNDTYGHDAGDELIKTVVNAFTDNIRASDYLFRMGGDEFMLVFPDANLADMENLVSRLQEILNKKELYSIPIDFSYGFAEFGPEDDMTYEELIKEADTCMFDQKVKKRRRLIKS
ncbi:MAG: diguanylate cyclase [Candidatus Electrothrix communis]|nr:MAG: diguanylate cyclase [Candidatus Electrothrix communis]